MELLNIELMERRLRLDASMAGWQRLYWGPTLVSELAATGEPGGEFTHTFELPAVHPGSGEQHAVQTFTLTLRLQWQPFSVTYSLQGNDQQLARGTRKAKDVEQQTPVPQVEDKPKFNLVGLGLLGLKLLKSAKVIKAALAGASLAAYSWLFSLEFALALIACLVVHEYGHIRAMKYFNMPTKGIYLIPFFGGAALTDGKINTRWQDVVISIMGPVFGLFMSVLCLLLYWATGSLFFAGLAAFNALLNLFNLLPILPLDGGHILKSVSFSMNSWVGLIVCVMAAAFGVWLSYTLGLALLGFLLIIGTLEILSEWRGRYQSHLLPLDRYGQVFATVWYFSVLGSFVGIIWYLAGTGDDMLGLPLKILQS
ncbi:site-2 protease family protein [Simiduia sp. 21SJ11W-1]|uniref:site-2 protease family protein n=1 Tax=Simiduia sp. 21SJ11W-1 TaxID=2909669 RepID=UPI0020A03CBC|nr:site-2 protease family protein [Simiduia sp. 21SJ11W-1]UTA48370.1 site-2 protease family protein [Simiduia sp. 21SJ11W-1]